MTDRIVRFSNAIAGAFPDRMFANFAYHWHVRPPVQVKPCPNVIYIMWHYTPGNYAAPLNDPNDPWNAEFNAHMTAWLEQGASIMYGGYSSKSMWNQLPWPIARRLAKDLKYIHAIGIRNYTCMPHIPGRWGQIGAVIYLQAKLLWDISLNPEEIIQDYIEHSYGDAAEPMYEYFDTMENAAQAPGVYFLNNPLREAQNFLTPEVMARAGTFLSEANKLASTDRVRERVELVGIAHEYARRYLEIVQYLKQYDETKVIAHLETAEHLLTELDTYVKQHSYKDAVVYFGGEFDVLGMQAETWDWSGGLWREFWTRQRENQ